MAVAVAVVIQWMQLAMAEMAALVVVLDFAIRPKWLGSE
jgi:hypothetical protein